MAVGGTEGSWEQTSVAVWEPAQEPVFGTEKREFRKGSERGWGGGISTNTGCWG